jgi:DNA-binding response OmpR family regulator
MKADKVMAGKRVLVVDDEKDVLVTLVNLLDICKVDAASSFEEGKKMMEENKYDIAVLDIMGVNGYELLKIAREKRIPALMLTAHALSGNDLKRSADEGAAYFAPKERIGDIRAFVADVLESIQTGKSPWHKVFDRLGTFYDKRFQGPHWREKEKEFWEKKVNEVFPAF